MSFFALDFTRNAPVTSYMYWLNLDPRYQISGYDKWIAMRGARSMAVNNTDIKGLIGRIATLESVLTPQVSSGDEDWDRLAQSYFVEYVSNPYLFDRAGKLNWDLAQYWLCENAIIDGDCFTVAVFDADGAHFQFYKAPQCYSNDKEGFIEGIKQNAQGRAQAYAFHNYRDNRSVEIPASHVFHYATKLDPCAVRGDGELIAAMTNAADKHQIDAYHKTQIQASASIAYYEYKPSDTKYATASLPSREKVQQDKLRAELDGKDTVSGNTDEQTKYSRLLIADSRIPALAPGHEVRMLEAKNPTQEVRQFVKDLKSSLAESLELAPQLIYALEDLNTANARMIMQLLQPWLLKRLVRKRLWCSFVWRRVILGAIASGALPPCLGQFDRVKWISQKSLTMDVAREGRINLELVREGYKNPLKFMQELNGEPFEDTMDDLARYVVAMNRVQERTGISKREMAPGVASGQNQQFLEQNTND